MESFAGVRIIPTWTKHFSWNYRLFLREFILFQLNVRKQKLSGESLNINRDIKKASFIINMLNDAFTDLVNKVR